MREGMACPDWIVGYVLIGSYVVVSLCVVVPLSPGNILEADARTRYECKDDDRLKRRLMME
jgi:hypothetical protein